MFQDILLASLPASWTDVFDVDHILTYVLAFLLISIFVMLFYNRLYVFRERDMESLGKSQNERLALVLQTGNRRLWLYDVVNRHYIILSKKGNNSGCLMNNMSCIVSTVRTFVFSIPDGNSWLRPW